MAAEEALAVLFQKGRIGRETFGQAQVLFHAAGQSVAGLFGYVVGNDHVQVFVEGNEVAVEGAVVQGVQADAIARVEAVLRILVPGDDV